MKVHTRRPRRLAGFSLTELLVVIGIMAVLLAVAVPSVIHYRRELKLTELDDNARAVFVAAQNHLTALRSASAGELEVSAAVGRSAKDVPGGAVSGLEAGTRLLYVSTDVTGAEPGWLVLPGSIEEDIAEGSYLVEFEPVSGAVYGVFFTERGSQALDESAYQTLYQYADGGNSCRVQAGRKSFARAGGGFYVGYYGADGALDITRPDAQALPDPKLKLTNAEELRLEIGTDPASWPSTIDQDKVFVSVSVTDGATSKTLVKKGAILSGSGATVVLDTLKTSGYNQNDTQNTAGWTAGGSFAQWVENGGSYVITPGANITVTVSTWYQPDTGEGVVALPKTASVSTNSLFAARTEGTVRVAYGRHLQNLGAAELDSAVTAAVQVREIDFNKTAAVGEEAIHSWADTYGHTARPFVPIANTHLGSYDGGGLAIRNLYAVQASGRYENAGLFATFTGDTLVNVTLVDARATGTYAGALAGTVQNATVDGCRAYLTQYTDAVRIQGTTRAGGLVGTATDSAIQNGSFASTVVKGGTVGGLVGYGSGVTVTTSYAAGHLTGATVGGLVGSGSGVSVENCYAAGTIAQATGAAGGLSAGSATVRNAYAAVEYVDVPAADAVYGAVRSGSCSRVYYLVKGGVNDAVTVTGVTAIADAERMKKGQSLSLLGSAFAEGGRADVKVQPYNLPNAADGGARDPRLYAPYPYPTLALGEGTEKEDLQHYGDWLSTSDAVFLAYFERYADDTYGFYYEYGGEDGTIATADTLKNDAVVLEDGYGALATSKPTLTAVGGAVTLGGEAASLTIDDKAYQLYPLDGTWLQTSHGYQQVTLGGQSFWLDPDFAKTATLTETTTATADAFAVRTVRQLANLDALDNYAAKTFTQERNIDGGSYAGTLYGKAAGDWRTFPVQFDDAPFQGVFTGGMGAGLSIRNLLISGGDNAGLFGVVDGGTVRDVKLENCRVSGGASAGAVIGSMRSGLASNSGVYVVNAQGTTQNAPYGAYPVTATGSAGGFVGTLSGGTVRSCFAAVQVSGATAGGLVGSLTGGSVTGSYAGGHMVDGVFAAPDDAAGKVSNVTGSAAAGGFAGSWTGGEISGVCYTTASVNAPTVGAFAASYPAGVALGQSYARNSVFRGGAAVSQSADIAALGLGSGKVTGEKGKAHPYDATVLTEEYDYVPIPGLDHYGDWPEVKMLHGIVAYYEQFETPSGLAIEFSYYDKNVLDAGGNFIEQGNLNASRTGSLYSDGYAFLSLNQLHETGQETQPVTMMVAIGTNAELKEQSTAYLGTYQAGDGPCYYAYGLPNAALDGAVAAEDYFLQLRVAGLDSDLELDSLWLNPHFGKAAYNGYGETNPGVGTPQVPIPSASTGTISIRSVRQFNNMRKYKSAIRSWVQELDMDAAAYKGHMTVDSEGYVTLGGLRVTVKGPDGTWQPTTDTSAVNGTYRLAFAPITMTSPSKGLTQDTWGGAYDGGGRTIANLSVGEVTGVGSNNTDRYYAGLFCNLSSSSAVRNLTLANCDVTGRSGSDKDYVGALTGYTEGTIENCTVLNTSVTAVQQDGGEGGYTGGLVGYVRKGTVQNCGVRVEGESADALYTACAVTGAGNIGGFTGYQKDGVIQYSYAAVKVSGKVSGGFIGILADSGVISNCYAAGHTQNGVYLASAPNVTGTSRAGGFAGLWGGGTLDGLCYTTCSVTGGNGEADVFATAASKTAPAGFYAGGDVYVGGSSASRSAHNATQVAVRTLATEPDATQADAHPYDAALPAKYPHKPVTYADGTPMPHYGDWYRKSTSATREWVQQTATTMGTTYDNFTATADWAGDTLNLTFDVQALAGEQNVANTGPNHNGYYAVTTDLGYRLIFRIFYNGDGTYEIQGIDGATWSCVETAPLNDPDRHIVLDFTIPTALIPPYLNSISISALDVAQEDVSAQQPERFVLTNIQNTDSSYHGVTAKALDATITIDGDFSDWEGYEHQLMEGLPAGSDTPVNGHWSGSILGYKNKIYVHMINEDKNDFSQVYSGMTLNNLSMFKFFIKEALDTDGNALDVSSQYSWAYLLGNSAYPDPLPGTVEETVGPEIWSQNTETWEWTVEKLNIYHFIFTATEDRQEYELEIDLDALAQSMGLENGDVFGDLKLGFNDALRVLDIKRVPMETE